MDRSTAIKFALVLLGMIGITSIFATHQSYHHTLPEYLDRPINDSITFINLLLDETHHQILSKNQLNIVTLGSMGRGIDQGGRIDAAIKVGRFVFRRFLDDVESSTQLMTTEALEYLQKACQDVQNLLSEILAPCEVARVRVSIDHLLERISPAFSSLRESNKKRQWDLYERVAKMFNALHKYKCRNENEYSDELEAIVEYGASYSARFDNEVALQEEYYLKQVADEMRQLVWQALDTRSSKEDL